ncbi:MAG TPA: MerR family transcriptional regulator [Pseudonocardiaceae bacterium]|jgi:DNA-binding transcriptional MerR regulator|nr:MerR family transcriptional regulator [Pseudonocardiaceae bacterium]
MSIGVVLAQLRPEFPDVTISKIRFLEAEGLISPARTASGYRQFGEVDVARLRFVLAAQRDRYLPLKVIREQLAAARPLAAVPEPEPPAAEPVGVSRPELAAHAGVDADLVADLEQYGLLTADAAGRYDPDAARIAAIAGALAAYGIEARHLRAFRVAADREAGLLAQIITPLRLHRDPATRARADEVRSELVELSARLHSLLVKAGLRASAGG